MSEEQIRQDLENLPQGSQPAVVQEVKAVTEPVKDPTPDHEAINRQYAEEIADLKANLEMVRQSIPREKTPEPDDFGGLHDDDWPTVKDMKKVLGIREKQYREAIEEAQVASQYSDYREVISSYLPKLLKEKPNLRGSIEHSPNKALAAYELAQMYKASRDEGKSVKKASDEAARIVKNTSKPGSLSQVGGQSSMSSADYYSSMSDNDFAQLVADNLERS